MRVNSLVSKSTNLVDHENVHKFKIIIVIANIKRMRYKMFKFRLEINKLVY